MSVRVRARTIVAGFGCFLTLAYALRPGAALLSIGLLALLQALVLAVGFHLRPVRRALLIGLSFTVAFFFGELLAQRAWPIAPHRILPLAGSPVEKLYLPDPELGLVMAPGFQGYFMHPEYRRESFETNSLGFRGPEWLPDLQTNAPRLLLLGDSTAIGFGVDQGQTIGALLESKLQAEIPGARVFDGAQAGFGPRHERVLLERLADRVRPTQVVVIFYDGNDLQNCRAQFVLARKNGQHDQRLPSEGPGPDRTPTPSRPPSLLSRWYWSHRSALYHRVETLLLPWLVTNGVIKHHAYGGILRLTQRPMGPAVQEEFDLAWEAIVEMNERARQLGAGFLFVRMPMRVQTELQSFERLVKMYDLDPAQQDRVQPGGALVDACRERGIPVLDLLPLFETSGPDPNRHYYQEGHPNDLGNRLTADQIGSFLLENGFFN